MANKHRAEKIFIFDDKAWRLRCSLQILAEIEGESGQSLAMLIEKIAGNLLSEADYLALEHVIRRNLKMEEPLAGRQLSSFKRQVKELLLDSFTELNPKCDANILAQQIERESLDIPWSELMHICVYHLKIPFEQFWNLSLPEVKVLLNGLGGAVYSKISPDEIKEMRDILTLA